MRDQVDREEEEDCYGENDPAILSPPDGELIGLLRRSVARPCLLVGKYWSRVESSAKTRVEELAFSRRLGDQWLQIRAQLLGSARRTLTDLKGNKNLKGGELLARPNGQPVLLMKGLEQPLQSNSAGFWLVRHAEDHELRGAIRSSAEEVD
jgi:hypothetical protein